MSPGDVASTAQTGSGTCPVEVEGVLQGKLSWWYLFAMAVASILGPWVVMSQFLVEGCDQRASTVRGSTAF